MDTEKIVQGYMDKYYKLIESEEAIKIEKTINDLNDAIENSDTTAANIAYSKILDWNFKVANLEGEKDSINKHIKGVRVPSPAMYAVVYDDNEKVWKFNI